jgi:hypothetical protein
MFEFNASKDILREVAVRKVPTHLCLTLVIKELKINVELGRVVTTLNVIKKPKYSYLVYLLDLLVALIS